MLDIRRTAKNFGLKVACRIDLLLSPVRKEFNRPKVIYILMLRPLGLGDLMMLSPFVLEIAARFNGVPVILVTEYPSFMELPDVSWMHPQELDVEKRKAGLVISPTLSWRHAKYLWGCGWYLGYFFSNRIMSNFAVQGTAYNAKQDHYYQRAIELLKVLEPWVPAVGDECRYPALVGESVCSVGLPNRYVCIAPIANWEERQYPVERFRQIATQLARRCTVVLLGGNSPAEQKLAECIRQDGVVDLVGKTTLGQASEIIANAMLFIGNDSGLAHVAFLAGIPSVVVFGCVPGELRIPQDSRLAGNVTVLGAGGTCPHFPCYDGFNRPHCVNVEPLSCLRGVSVSTVVDSAEAVLDSVVEGVSSIAARKVM